MPFPAAGGAAGLLFAHSHVVMRRLSAIEQTILLTSPCKITMFKLLRQLLVPTLLQYALSMRCGSVTMASSNPHGFVACQEFNTLIDKITNTERVPSAKRGAALLGVSKTPLIREVLQDMGYTNDAPVRVEGNNAVRLK